MNKIIPITLILVLLLITFGCVSKEPVGRAGNGLTPPSFPEIKEKCIEEKEICDGLDNDCDGEIDEGELCSKESTCLNGKCQLTEKTVYGSSNDLDLIHLTLMDESFDEPKYQGYIVKLKEKPIIAYKKELEEDKLSNSLISEQVNQYRTNLLNTHNNVKSRIKQLVPSSKITREYFNVYNGFSLNVSDKEIEKIRQLPEVEGVYLNYGVQAALMDSVPLINADDVWALGYTGEGMTIAIIDSGVDYTHSDLGLCFGEGCKVVGGYDFVNDDSNSMDDQGHGTHCAGIAAANPSDIVNISNPKGSDIGLPNDDTICYYDPYFYDKISLDRYCFERGFAYASDWESIETPCTWGACYRWVGSGWAYLYSDESCPHTLWVECVDTTITGLKGVAPDAQLYAYKVLDSEGNGWNSDVMAAIERSVDPNNDGNFDDHVDVISMSLGVPYYYFDDCYEVGSSTAVDNAVDAGVIVVVAAGNEYNYKTIRAPGCARKVITVGASDKSDVMAEFSSKGPTKDLRVKPDVVAPGVSICSAQWDDAWSGLECFDDEHVAISGTSMATPHVAGATALIKQAHPDWTPDEIKLALRNTTVNLGDDVLTQGWGRINVLATVQSGKPPIAVLDTSGIVNGTIDITGTATADNFDHYVLEYGEGYEPDSWTLLIESYTPIIENILATINSFNLDEEGRYALRLRVFGLGGTITEDKSIIFVMNDYNACYTCEGCDYKVDVEGAQVTLANDISSDGVCIEIEANDVILDCNGYSLTKTGDSFGEGIKSYGKSGVTIKNCEVNNYDAPYAVWLYYVNNFNLNGNTLQNSEWGLRLRGNDNTLTNNQINNSAGPNLFITGYDNSVDTTNKINGKPVYYFFDIHDTTIENLDTYYLHVAYSSNVTIKNIDMNNGDGIHLEQTIDSNIANNELLNGAAQHILLDYESSNNHIENNVLSWANFDGIRIIFDSINNTVRNNYISNNFYGVSLSPSQSNRVVDNNIISNFLGVFVTDSNNEIINNNIVLGGPYSHGSESGHGKGIALYEVSDSNIMNNTISNSGAGSLDYYGEGVKMAVASNHNFIKGNKILSMTYGINLEAASIQEGCNNNTIQQNIISDSQCGGSPGNGVSPGKGIYIRNSANNLIIENDIHNFSGCLGYGETQLAYGIYLGGDENTLFYHNTIYNISLDSMSIPISSDRPIELAYNNHGNFWGRTEQPYFCEYANQHPNCMDNWDSTSPDVIDPCPYNQSYPPGEWPDSPVCLPCDDVTPHGECFTTQPLYCDNGELINNCQECGCPPGTNGCCKDGGCAEPPLACPYPSVK